MTIEEIAKESKSDDKKEEQEEDAKKSFDATLIETLSTLTEHVKAQSESLAALDERVSKALEEKPETQLDLPNTSDDEGIGEDVKVPDTYQSNSVQAGLDDDKTDDTKKDPEDLVMQEKAEKTNFEFTTETPRPTSSIETVNKSEQSELNMVLKDARTEGFDGLSVVAQKILKGDYYTPTQEEAWF